VIKGSDRIVGHTEVKPYLNVIAQTEGSARVACSHWQPTQRSGVPFEEGGRGGLMDGDATPAIVPLRLEGGHRIIAPTHVSPKATSRAFGGAKGISRQLSRDSRGQDSPNAVCGQRLNRPSARSEADASHLCAFCSGCPRCFVLGVEM
jgi:hypothetical protein